MNKMHSLSLKMQHVFETLFFILPMCNIGYWLLYELFDDFGIHLYSIVLHNHMLTINASSKILAMLVTFIPTAIIMVGIYNLKKLFQHYANNQIFTQQNTTIYNKIGICLFALTFGNILISPLLSLALSYQNPVGERFIAVSFGLSELITLITAFMVTIIAYVMKVGHELEIEARSTI